MVRYTTPTFTLTLPDSVDLTQATNVYVTFAKGDNKMTKTDEEIEVSAHSVDVYLSQEETAAFTSGLVQIQMNWTYSETGGIRRACTEIVTVNVTPNLLNEVVE